MLSIVTGYDPGYLNRNATPRAVNYYTVAIKQHGEPPGRWWGRGAEALGFQQGSEIDPKVMEKLYSTFLDPRDPNFLKSSVKDEEKERLGRRPPQFRDAEAWYEVMSAKEPEATEERRKELWAEAAKKAERQKTVFFYDATFSPVKSVSLLHAGLVSAMSAAEKAGDTVRAEEYRKRADAVEKAVMVGASASLEYLKTHAGDARTGYHGGTVEGRSTGRWTEAGGWVVSQYLQHTNREGEPAMHVHQAILGRQICKDGEWRGIDSRALFRSRAGAAAEGERAMMQEMTRTLGADWKKRADGHGWELKGVSAEKIMAFSSRRSVITDKAERWIQDYVDAHGRQPSARVLFKICQDATLSTRKSKEPKLDRVAQLLKWEKLADRLEIGSLMEIPQRVLGRIGPEQAEQMTFDPAEAEIERIITTAVSRAQAAKSVFTRHDVYRYVNSELPGYLGSLSLERCHRLIDELTDKALDPAGPAGVRLLNAPDVVHVPEELRREDGRSVYLAPNAERYTTVGQLDAEQRLTAEALRTDAPRIELAPAEMVQESVEAFAASAEAARIRRGLEEPEADSGPAAEAGADGREDVSAKTAPVRSKTVRESAEAPAVSGEAPESSEENRAEIHEKPEGLDVGPQVSSEEGTGTASDAAAAQEEPHTGGEAPERDPRRERLIQAHRDAEQWFRAQLMTSQAGQRAREYTAGRGLAHVLAEDSPWQVGYGPDKPYALFDHLSSLGYTNEELVESGLVGQSKTGAIFDRFQHRLVIAIRNENGDPVAFTGRVLPGGRRPDERKYINSPDTPIFHKKEILFGLGDQADRLAAGARPVVVEGPLDVLAVAGAAEQAQQGERGLVAVAAEGTSLTPQHVEALSRAADPEAGVVVAFDADKAGAKAAVRAYDLLRDYAGPVNAAELPPGVDPGDLAGDPERLHRVLDERDRLLLETAVAARVEAHRFYPKRRGPGLSGEELRRQAARSWGEEPAPAQQSMVGDTGAQVQAEDAPQTEGVLTVEGGVAAIEEVAGLIGPARPDAAALVGRAVQRLAAETGWATEHITPVLLDALLPSDEQGDEESTRAPGGDAWEKHRDASHETPDASSQTAPSAGGREAGQEQGEAETGHRGQDAPEAGPAERPMSEETARALRDSERVRAEVLRRWPSLHIDQADAIAGIATSGRGVDVLVGPAGSGKSFTLGALATFWAEQTQAPVVGLATAQSAANVLAEEGLEDTANIEKWLRDVEAGRRQVVPGTLIVVDEASMATTPHLDKIQQAAAAGGAKLVWAGDHAQLNAPGAAGAMRHLAEVGGSYELTQVRRFTAEWERTASLGLRDGSTEALSEYDRHGRLMAGVREDAEAAALSGYLSDYRAGRQTLLLTSTNERASALSGQVRAALVEAGLVEESGVELRDANTAGVGDLIMARANESEIRVPAGGGRTRRLTNRDTLRVVEVCEDGAVRAALEGTGAPVYLPAGYVNRSVELAYSGTTHSAQGRTVDTCHSVVDESTTLEMLYVMLTRGRHANLGYGVVDKERVADLRTGPEQAQEHTERLRADAARRRGEEVPEAARAEERRRADEMRLAVFGAAMERQMPEGTAVEAMLGEAERPRDMAHLGAMWLDVTRQYTARAHLERAVERGVLPREHADRALEEDALGTLGRLLTRLETAGYAPGAILDDAISSRGRVELETADSVTRVLHWRIVKNGELRGVDMENLEPGEQAITATWAERTTPLGLPAIDAFRAEVAARMDARAAELGERAAERPPRWLVEKIGHAPAEGSERERWVRRAGRVLSYREHYMHTAEADAIGPAPSRSEPEQRAAWMAARDALGTSAGERDLSAATLGELHVMRAAYIRQARWAPAYVADALRTASREVRELGEQVQALSDQVEREQDPDRRAALEAQVAAKSELAGELAAHREELAAVDRARSAWYDATEDARILAERADRELRRRAAEDQRVGRAPRVDVDALEPLHGDAAGRERAQAQQRRAAQAAAERGGPIEGQLTLADIEPAVEPEDAREPEHVGPEVEVDAFQEDEGVRREADLVEAQAGIEEAEAEALRTAELETPPEEVDPAELEEASRDADEPAREQVQQDESFLVLLDVPATGRAEPRVEAGDEQRQSEAEQVQVAEGQLTIDGLEALEQEHQAEQDQEAGAAEQEADLEAAGRGAEQEQDHEVEFDPADLVAAEAPALRGEESAEAALIEAQAELGQEEDEPIAEQDAEAQVDVWERRAGAERPSRAAEQDEPAPEHEAEAESVCEGQLTIYASTEASTTELDRTVEQARHAAALAAHLLGDHEAAREEQAEAERLQRQREAREVDMERAEREQEARAELEERQGEREAEADREAEYEAEPEMEEPEL